MSSAAPRRIQRKRAKGWRKPDNTVIVDRTSRWGNPFKIESAREVGYSNPEQMTVKAFKDWLNGDDWACGCLDSYEGERAYILANIEQLRGKNLACPCPLDQPCHADVLLEIANG